MTDRTRNINFNPNQAEEIKTGKVAPTPKKTKKDFKKILAKENREDTGQSKNKELDQKAKTDETDSSYEDVELKLEAYDQKPKTKAVSLFDIASDSVEEVEAETTLEVDGVAKTEEGEEELPLADMPENIQEESLSALFKGYGTKEKLLSMQVEMKNLPSQSPENAAGRKDSLATPQDDLQKPVGAPGTKESKTELFSREQGDLAAVNPNAGLSPTPAALQTQGVQSTNQPVRAQELQEIVDQIVSKLYTLSSKGKTDTLIKLQHPPLFAGSSVVITSFDSAKGEFNITFENLTQAAKQMMDMQENQNSLKFALEQKGYTVHMITATTLAETTHLVEGQSQGRERQEDQGDSSKEQQEQEQEEETT